MEESGKNDECKQLVKIVAPIQSLSMPSTFEGTQNKEIDCPKQTYLRPVNIDIVITPCDSTVQSPYEQTSLMTKLMRSHKRILRKNRHSRLDWLCSSANEKRLRTAASTKDSTTAKNLISKHPDIDLNCSDEKQRTPLHICAANGCEEIVRLLLENGASPDVKDVNGNTPLHLAACSGKVPIVTLLLHHGADISATDSFGKTPLHLALARLRVFHKSDGGTNEPCFNYLQRRAHIKDIADLLKEYFYRKGTEKEKADILMLSNQISSLTSKEQVMVL